MLKTGIYQRDQLSVAALQGWFGRRKFVAVTLYEQIAAATDPDRERLLEHMLARFPAANGTYKRTQSHRFEEFDARVIQELLRRFNPSFGYTIHDIGVSDGRTAVDFFGRLGSLEHFKFSFLAGDASPNITAVASPGMSLVVVVDPVTRAPLQVIWPPFVFNVAKRESALLYPVNRLILFALLRTRVRALLARLEANDPALNVTRIRLLSPECLRLLASDSRFTFERYNVLEPAKGRFNLVRAMNVLNRGYFSDADLRLASANVHGSLIPGGLFVTGSNEDAGSSVDGAIYERTETGFRQLWVSGAGSQIDGILTGGVAPVSWTPDPVA
jgi:chemotaxis methyl-accepting protein methylase